MRRAVERAYQISEALAGIFLIGIFFAVFVGIIGRLMGFHVRGTDAYAGYSMAAAAFLALGPALRNSAHIRVTVLLTALPERGRWILDKFSDTLGLAIVTFLAFYSVRLAVQSYEFGDVSQANDATPLWIPQIAMAIGSCTLALAFFERLLASGASRKAPSHISE